MFTEIWIVIAWLLSQITQASAPQKPAAENVEIRYARAQLQLAETNLKRVDESNKRMERSVPSSVVAEYRYDIEIAKMRLQQTTSRAAMGEFSIWLQRAEAERKTAETTWKNATIVNSRAAGTFAPLDIERYRLRAEVAKLQLERGQSLTNSSRETQLQWELDVLINQVQRLQEESRQQAPWTGYFPYWW
jgi:multidrug resistance efflux pump